MSLSPAAPALGPVLVPSRLEADPWFYHDRIQTPEVTALEAAKYLGKRPNRFRTTPRPGRPAAGSFAGPGRLFIMVGGAPKHRMAITGLVKLERQRIPERP